MRIWLVIVYVRMWLGAYVVSDSIGVYEKSDGGSDSSGGDDEDDDNRNCSCEDDKDGSQSGGTGEDHKDGGEVPYHKFMDKRIKSIAKCTHLFAVDQDSYN